MPKGLADLWSTGMGTAESLMGIPQTMKYFVYAGLAIAGVLLVAVVFTACYGVGSGKINVNELAQSAATVAEHVPIPV
jgi:hypothetical protein